MSNKNSQLRYDQFHYLIQMIGWWVDRFEWRKNVLTAYDEFKFGVNHSTMASVMWMHIRMCVLCATGI